MDKENLNMIKDKLLNVKMIVETAIDQLDVETIESIKTGKSIAVDFDDSDLTSIQVSVDEAASLLQNLSVEIESYT